MKDEILQTALSVFDTEIEALQSVRSALAGQDGSPSFRAAVEAILGCHGKVIITGLGKSGAIGRKIAATLSSTGTPSVFVHATEGGHGDLGIIDRRDLVIAISYSGESDEMAQLLPAIQRLGVTLIAITGAAQSLLARSARIVLSVMVPKEACPMGLAPTSSTTAMLVMGDALAVALYEARGFTPEDFAFRHPGGALGRSLLSVSDLMHTGDELPRCQETDALILVILEMTRKKLGMACITDGVGKLTGIFTDGDLRRLIEKHPEGLLKFSAGELMSKSPRTISPETLAVQALTLMESRRITSLVVVDKSTQPMGVIHIHDILRSKVV
ncbi:MAG: KpsF/GutQ family sugar-phosphate isomerase [Candidatus Hydrogenedentota bacterium]